MEFSKYIVPIYAGSTLIGSGVLHNSLLVTAIGGDDFYLHKLKTDYPDREKEIKEINNLLSIVDSLTLKKINDKYTSFRSMHV